MNRFLILILTAVVCSATPQGYNYPQQQQTQRTNLIQQPEVGFSPVPNRNIPLPSSESSSRPSHAGPLSVPIPLNTESEPSSGPNKFSVPNSVSESIKFNEDKKVNPGSDFIAGTRQLEKEELQKPQLIHQPFQSQPNPATSSKLVSKHFYIHSAPEDQEDDADDLEYENKHKHYRVLFVKPPAPINKAAVRKLARTQNELKTVVYVLNQQTDVDDLQTEYIQARDLVSKPEVFFIKYKTPEEAARAQEQIQASYDALGGTSQITDEGHAPVQSFIGTLDGSQGNYQDVTQTLQSELGGAANDYKISANQFSNLGSTSEQNGAENAYQIANQIVGSGPTSLQDNSQAKNSEGYSTQSQLNTAENNYQIANQPSLGPQSFQDLSQSQLGTSGNADQIGSTPQISFQDVSQPKIAEPFSTQPELSTSGNVYQPLNQRNDVSGSFQDLSQIKDSEAYSAQSQVNSATGNLYQAPNQIQNLPSVSFQNAVQGDFSAEQNSAASYQNANSNLEGYQSNAGFQRGPIDGPSQIGGNYQNPSQLDAYLQGNIPDQSQLNPFTQGSLNAGQQSSGYQTNRGYVPPSY